LNEQLKGAFPSTLLRWIVGGAGGGIGVGILFVLYEIYRARPDAVIDVLRAWGPLFIPLMVVLLFGYRQNERGIRTQQEVASSQRELVGQMHGTVNQLTTALQIQGSSMKDMTEAMNRIANKDNELLLRLEARIDETSDRARRILEWIEREEERRHAQDR